MISQGRPRKPVETVQYAPDSRDWTRTFRIPRSVAERLYRDGRIAVDATNSVPGGERVYCPAPGKRENMSIHRVPD